MENVRLKNGAEVPKIIASTTTLSLKALWESNPLVVYDFVMLAKDPDYVPFGNVMEVLSDYHLVSNGEIPKDVREVVLSSIEGEGPAMRLVNPVAR